MSDADNRREADAHGASVLELLKRHAAMILEKAGNVQAVEIVVVADVSGLSQTTRYGSGNWYARYGALKEWYWKQSSRSRPTPTERQSTATKILLDFVRV